MAPSNKLIPAATHDDQEEIMAGRHGEPIRLGSAPFSSYDPATDAKKLLPLEDGTSAHRAAQDAADARDSLKTSDYSDLKNADLKQLVTDRGLTAESNKNDDLRAALLAADAEDMKAKDFIEAINAATTVEELDAAYQLYTASGNDFVTVDRAYEVKFDELDGDDNNSQ